MDETSEAKEKISSSDQYLSTKKLNKNLKTRTIQGAAVTMTAQIGKLFLTLVSTAVLARQLTPEDFGLLGMVTIITGFIGLFSDLGLSTATIQRENINHKQVSTLFWFNVLLGILVMLLTIGLSPVLAWFYQESRLLKVAMILSTNFLLAGFSIQHKALLKRQMKFSHLAFIDSCSVLVGILIAIVSAYCGFGYWALVWQQIAVQMVTTLLILSLCKWKPSFIIKRSEVGSLLAFGSNLSGFNVFNYFARNTDNFLIGYFWGTAELGLYSKAYQLLMFPIQKVNVPVSTIAVPSLSRIVQEEERYKKAYLKMVGKIAILMMPVVVFMIIDSKWLIQILLGSQWIDASRIFAWLGLAALIQPITNTTGWIFITRGQTRQMFLWGIFGSVLTIISILIGLPWGALGVAASYSLSSLFIRTPLLLIYIGKVSPIKISDFLMVLKIPLMLSLSVFTALSFVRKIVELDNPFYGIFLHGSITFIILFGVILFIYKEKDFRKLLSFLR